jgi:type IV pilus assembly protein PilB
MPSASAMSGSLRRMLLLKVISKPSPSREDVQSVIELTSSKVVEALQAQAMTLYLLEGENIAFKHVYFSPTLWSDDPALQEEFSEKQKKLLELKLPKGTGVVGKVIENSESIFFSATSNADQMHNIAQSTGFEVTSMITVPLVASTTIGAIQVLNKEPSSGMVEFSPEDLDVLKEVAEYSAPLLGRMMDAKFELSDRDTAKFISKFTGNDLIESMDQLNDIDEKLLEVVGDSVVRREGIFPIKRLSPTACSALMANPLDYPRRESFATATEMQVEEVFVAPASLIEELIKTHFKESTQPDLKEEDGDVGELVDALGAEYVEKMDDEGDGLDDEESAPVIQLANRIVEDAYITGASDIHVEPQENELLVRYRIDGICQEKLRLPKSASGALVARYKVMSELDIAEKRLPQDGRIVFKKYTKKNIDIDLRVATGPMNFGEKVVMRILDKSKSALPITALGFSDENLGRYRACIEQPYGMLLHCGPTGSGKSMTLFSALREIADPTINIQTAEDPIEYTIPGINQMQMHKSIGLDFSRALRAYLRMDPDIILVGEIRDQETAEIAVEAALTGHLLLSTLHTNDAPSTVARFTDMGIEPFMISTSLLVVCAQRLMRRVNKKTAVAYTPEGNEAEILQNALGWVGEIYRAADNDIGGPPMKGRVGIHELMTNSEELTKAINANAETAVLKRVAMRSGMKTLHQDSMLKVKEGTSTMVEALANVPPDMIKGEDPAEEEELLAEAAAS